MRLSGKFAGMRAFAWLLIAFLGIHFLSEARGELLLRDSFDYPDGFLVSVAAATWRHHSGTESDLWVSGGSIWLSQTNTEDTHVLIPGGPYVASSNQILFASFVLRATSLPGKTGDYFCHFKDNGSGFRGRLFVTTQNAASGFYRLGISNSSNTFDAQFEKDLELEAEYRIVVRYEVTNCAFSLWIDPLSEDDRCVTASDEAKSLTVTAFAFRQNSGIGKLQISDLSLATSFNDLNSKEPPSIMPSIFVYSRLENLKRSGDALTNQYTEQVLQPGETWRLSLLLPKVEGNPIRLQLGTNSLPEGARWDLIKSGDQIDRAELVCRAEESDAGKQFNIGVLAESDALSNSFEWTLYVPTAIERQIAITEFLANPTAKLDAPDYNPLQRIPAATNTSVADEYIEFVNFGPSPMDLSGWTISDALRVRHRFADNFKLESCRAVVVCGAPITNSTLSSDAQFISASASTAGLSLNNSGEEIILLRNARSNLVMRIVYQGNQLSTNGSLARFPNSASPFVPHCSISANYVSPGVQNDGTSWALLVPPPSEIGPLSITSKEEKYLMTWPIDPSRTYQVWRKHSLAVSWESVVAGLKFEGAQGTFVFPIDSQLPACFFQISSP